MDGGSQHVVMDRERDELRGTQGGRTAATAHGELVRNPKPRSSPRLSESAKRRRTEAVRGGVGLGPGAAALQALGLADDPDEAAANAAAAAQVDAEMQVDDGAGVGLDDSVDNL